MKKTIKVLLLAVLVLCTICALTVMASASEELLGEGYVTKYATYVAADSEENVLNDGTNAGNDLYWTLSPDGVLTITGTSTKLDLNPNGSWLDASLAAALPWWSLKSQVKKVVVEAPVTEIESYVFDQLTSCVSVEFPADSTSIKVGGMAFAYMGALTTIGLTGSLEENVLDLRVFNGSGNQVFENSSKGKTITVLLPYSGNAAFNANKVFADTTTLTFKVTKGSAGETLAKSIATNAVTKVEDKTGALVDRSPYANVVNVEYYSGFVVTGMEAANTTDAKWSLDLDSGALLIEVSKDTATDKWYQIDFQDKNWTAFASAWKHHVKDVTVSKFDKVSLGNGGTQCFLSGSTSLETVTFAKGQRLQNGYPSNQGWFANCPALKSVTFGGTLEDGVADLSGAAITAGQDSNTTWLDNMFKNCTSIEKIVLPTGAAVTNLPASAIAGCTALTDIVVGANIATIEEGTFAAWIDGTEGYADLTVTFTEENSAVGLALKETAAGKLNVVVPEAATGGDVSGDATDDNNLKWAFDIATGKLTISGTSTSIVWKDGATAGWNGKTSDYTMVPWYSEYKNLITEVEITAPVTSIPAYMFGATPKVETVILPAECVAFQVCAFVGCANLTTLHTAGVDAPEGVIDCRNITGKSGRQFFESCFPGEATIWMPATAESFDTNYVFGLNGKTVARFVVYPGSAAETTVYNMINTPGSKVYGDITYSYYTADEDATLATWQDLLTGSQTSDYGVANWTLNVETGLVTVTVTKGTKGSSDCSVTNADWKTFLSTFKYNIKTIFFNTSAKLNAGGTINGLPELTTIIFNGTRMQGDTRFPNNKKLTTIGTSSNVVNGVVNLSVWQDINNSHNHSSLSSAYNGMFENCTSITKVILPKAGSKYGIISIGANTFKGCTGLETIVVPEGCALLSTAETCKEGTAAHASLVPVTGTIDATAFAGLDKAVTVVNEITGDATIANALIAVLPKGSELYKEAASSGEGLTTGVKFDGWKVRLEKYNGLRGIFHYDSTSTSGNAAAGWTLVEYGAVLSTSKNAAITGAKVYYDEEKGVTADATTKMFPIMRTVDGVLKQVEGSKVLTNTEDKKTNDVYYAVSIVKYAANYRTDVYMAGYEVYTNTAGDVVIAYTSCDPAETNIYEISLAMFKDGALAGLDGENIVWNTLTAGGGLVLEEGTHYTLDDAQINGTPTSMATGEPFDSTFNAWNVPVTGGSFVTETVGEESVTVLKFTETGLNYSLLADPDVDGKYILVYRGSGYIPGAGPYSGAKKYLPQLSTDWYTKATAATYVSNVMPNPRLTANIWGEALSTIILDKGVKGMGGSGLYGNGASTLIYGSTLADIQGTAFQNCSLATVYRAGTEYVEGVIEISNVAKVGTSHLFDGSKAVKAVHLPASANIATEAFKGCTALERVWIGDNAMPEVGVVDLSNLKGDSALEKHCFYNNYKINTLIIPESVTTIHAQAFEGVKTLTIQQSATVESIQTYVNTVNGTDGYNYTYTVLESLAGWSGIIVK